MYERVYSVEIITIISVPSRVVVACRVVPRSANALEIALALYDAIRPFSMVVDATTIDDFRWCGIPASLDFGDNPVTAHASRVRTTREITGRHVKPGIMVISLRADNGSIFLSESLRALLLDWGVDLMPSRPGRPVDNNIVERWHDSLQAAYQSFRNGAGFKGRAVHERGRFVGWVGFDPTANVPLAPDTPSASGVLGWVVDHLVGLLAAVLAARGIAAQPPSTAALKAALKNSDEKAKIAAIDSLAKLGPGAQCSITLQTPTGFAILNPNTGY